MDFNPSSTVFGVLFVAGGDTAEMLDLVEEALDKVDLKGRDPIEVTQCVRLR